MGTEIFSFAVAAKTNGSFPGAPRSISWIAVSDYYVGLGFVG